MILFLIFIVFISVFCNIVYLKKLNNGECVSNKFPIINRLLILIFIFSSYITYFFGSIKGITLLNLMITIVLVLIIWSIFIYNKHRPYFGKNTHFYFIIFISVFIIIDLKLSIYDKYDLRNYVNHGTFELGEKTNIYLLPLGIEDTPKGVVINSTKVIRTEKLNNLTRYFNMCTTCLPYKVESLFNNSDLDNSLAYAESYLGQETFGLKYLKSSINHSGNSAGLALVIAGLIEKGEMQNNQSIAITGAINSIGKVLTIGSVEEKVQIASYNNHDYIIVPLENYSDALTEAKKLNLRIKICPVETIDDAIMLVQELNRSE